MSVYRNNLIEQAKFMKRLASTVYAFGAFVQNNLLGQVIPLTPTAPVAGVGLQAVAASDPNYTAANADYPVDGIDVTVDRFLCDITGTATAAMVGSKFNISATDAGAVDVSTYSTLTYDLLATSTFAVGHVITGATSGATATILQVIAAPAGNGAAGTLIVGAVTGTFDAGETITDGTSSATAKLLTIVLGGIQFQLERFISTVLGEFSVAKNY